MTVSKEMIENRVMIIIRHLEMNQILPLYESADSFVFLSIPI